MGLVQIGWKTPWNRLNPRIIFHPKWRECEWKDEIFKQKKMRDWIISSRNRRICDKRWKHWVTQSCYYLAHIILADRSRLGWWGFFFCFDFQKSLSLIQIKRLLVHRCPVHSRQGLFCPDSTNGDVARKVENRKDRNFVDWNQPIGKRDAKSICITTGEISGWNGYGVNLWFMLKKVSGETRLDIMGMV